MVRGSKCPARQRESSMAPESIPNLRKVAQKLVPSALPGAPPPPEEPPPESGYAEGAAGAPPVPKQTKEEYRDHPNGQQHCGLCANFIPLNDCPVIQATAGAGISAPGRRIEPLWPGQRSSPVPFGAGCVRIESRVGCHAARMRRIQMGERRMPISLTQDCFTTLARFPLDHAHSRMMAIGKGRSD
jgi:hypothetical protein